MRILFTGASSFTGTWFVRELANAGHEVAVTLRSDDEAYEGVRKQRVDMLRGLGLKELGCRFGDARFMELLESSPAWDLLCHHAADVTNYKSPDFDVALALQNNTRNARGVLAALAEAGCRRILLTGSVFEEGEGGGSENLPSFSPYGLSKALTARVFGYYARECGMRIGKFVIANPFGPFEEPRFTAYLVRTWYAGECASVNTPAYVRDNIHVSLLARAYVKFATTLPTAPGSQKLSPSGYVESQGRFAERFASQMRRRLGLACELEVARQTEFVEPRIRINTDPPDADELGWNEDAAWDELADYYRRLFGHQDAGRSA